MTLSPESLRYLMLPKLGEALPWLTEAGDVRESFTDALSISGHFATPVEEMAILAREIWEGETSPQEKRLAWRLKDRPEEFCAFIFSGIAGSGFTPELAEWRASVRQRTLAVALAQLWTERREKTPEEITEEAADLGLPLQSMAISGSSKKETKKKKRRRSTVKSFWWVPSPLGTGFFARFANLALANVGACLVAANLFASFGAKALGWPHLSSIESSCASYTLVVWLGLEMFFKYKILGRVNSLPIWLWARAQLPSGGWLHGRAMERRAQRHWRLHGMTAEQAKETASAHLGAVWRRRNTKESARSAQSAALLERTKLAFPKAPNLGEILACLKMDPFGGLTDSGMAEKLPFFPPELLEGRNQLARLEAEIQRVDESMDIAKFAQRIAERESKDLAREIKNIDAAGRQVAARNENITSAGQRPASMPAGEILDEMNMREPSADRTTLGGPQEQKIQNTGRKARRL